MNWVKHNAKAINTLLQDYGGDTDYGLVLVLTQWSAPGYTRVVTPSNFAEEGIIVGREKSGARWIESVSPEGKQPTLTMIEHFDVPPPSQAEVTSRKKWRPLFSLTAYLSRNPPSHVVFAVPWV